VGIAAVGQFNFDDFTAKVTEQAAGVGTGDMTAHLNANSSFESANNHSLPNCQFVRELYSNPQ
jgi:hypothetical protein